MADIDAIDERLHAVERALTDSDRDLTELADAADHRARLETVEERLDALEERVDELDAGVQAVRGYVGNVRSVNRDVELRADAALAKSEALERRLDGHGGTDSRADREGRPDDSHGSDTGEGHGRESSEQEHERRVEDRSAQRVMDEATCGDATDQSQRRTETGRLYRRGRQEAKRDHDADEGDDGLLDGLRNRL